SSRIGWTDGAGDSGSTVGGATSIGSGAGRTGMLAAATAEGPVSELSRFAIPKTPTSSKAAAATPPSTQPARRFRGRTPLPSPSPSDGPPRWNRADTNRGTELRRRVARSASPSSTPDVSPADAGTGEGGT